MKRLIKFTTLVNDDEYVSDVIETDAPYDIVEKSIELMKMTNESCDDKLICIIESLGYTIKRPSIDYHNY